MTVHGLIMAGGSGTRFWPLSRRRVPKQCLSLDGGPSLLRATIDRLLPLISPAHLRVVTGEEMRDAVEEEVGPLPKAAIMVEPSARNTLPCIAWAASVLEAEGAADDVLVVLPADHHVADPVAFRAALSGGIEAAQRLEGLITLGLAPDRPETGFGYIELGPDVGVFAGQSLKRAAAFREKPGRTTAEAWVAGGNHRWNAGIFVFRASVFLSELERHQPRTRAALRGAAAGAPPPRWLEAEATSVDYGLMERSDRVYCLPSAFGWSDVGSWTGAVDLLPSIEGGRGRVAQSIALDATDNLLWAPGKLVATVGVSGVVLVDTPDALLLLDARRAQELRALIERLRAESPDRT